MGTLSPVSDAHSSLRHIHISVKPNLKFTLLASLHSKMFLQGHDLSADYWSLGILMFELLTGRYVKVSTLLFTFTNFNATIMAAVACGCNEYNLSIYVCHKFVSVHNVRDLILL